MEMKACGKPLDLLLKGGRIVTPQGVVKGSLGIADGKIAGIYEDQMEPEAAQTEDLSGKVIFPGAIDTHSHFFEPFPTDKEDFYHATMEAAQGGVTTCIEMPQSIPPVTDSESFRGKEQAASSKAVVDFALWGGCGPQWLGRMQELHQLGCAGFKLFTSDAGPNYAMCDDYTLIKAMERARALNNVVGVHAENNAVCMGLEEEFRRLGKTGPEYHEKSRPVYGELEAVKRVIHFAGVTGCPVLICHLGIPEGAKLIKEAKREGVPVFMETCPHYLAFDDTEMTRRGGYAKVNPPLRSRESVEGLWEYVIDGTVDCIGSDHGVYTEMEKDQRDIFGTPGGFPGIDRMMNVMISEGVVKRGVSLERIAEMMAYRPAQIFGLSHRKGSINIGADADLAVADLEQEWKYSYLDSFCKTKLVKYPYEGMEGKGQVVRTYVRGKLVYCDGEIKAKAGWGKFIKRKALGGEAYEAKR